MEKSCQLSMEYLQRLPDIQSKLQKDVQAAYDGDPAALILKRSYSRIQAYTLLPFTGWPMSFRMGLVLIARIMSEYAHSTTGIDIHPGAKIGESFFIDHGTE